MCREMSVFSTQRICQTILALLLLVLPHQAVFAHGGVSFENDVCILQVGNFRMHFTGYLPKVSRSEEFCEDIPGTGKVFIVFDMVDTALRNMQVEIRLLRDTGTRGINTSYADLGTRADIERDTIYTLPFVSYPKGTAVIEHEFLQPGKFIGMVELLVPGKEESVISVFPFSVGSSSIWDNWPYAVVLLSLVGLGLIVRVYWK